MKPGKHIQEELESLNSLLSRSERVNVFTVPEDFFSHFPDVVVDKCLFQSPIVQDSREVPVGYFDNLAGNILGKIKSLEQESAATELRKLSPMLYAIQGEEVFTVPKGYFDAVAHDTLSRITRKAKVIALKPVALWKYAVAAVVTGVIAVSSLWFANTGEVKTEDKIVAFQNAAVKQVINESAKYKTEKQITQELDALPSDAIINYLEKTGNSSDMELLSTTVDQQDLPSQVDYLSDEQALDNYLKELNSTEATN